jgi:hypothetical protein
VNCAYTPPKRATWTFSILSEPDADHLYEEAPYDEKTRAIWRLVEPVRVFLGQHEHHVSVDRGDFGDGDEFFHISLYSQEDADAFSQLCDGLRT